MLPRIVRPAYDINRREAVVGIAALNLAMDAGGNIEEKAVLLHLNTELY